MSEAADGARSLGPRRVIAAAAALTLLNALKPPTVDDAAYLAQAARWASNPADPFGGTALLYQHLVPAAQAASPPVGVAWLALGVALFGETPWALKLWLLPFAWLLAASFASLLRRIASPIAAPMLVLVLLSPAVLTSFNLMLDVPELALALATLAVFGRALDRHDSRLAAIAGVLAGLAVQTRYDAAPVLAALLTWSVAAGAWPRGAVAVGVAAATFGLVEAACFTWAHASPLAEYFAGRGARDPQGHDVVRTARKLVHMAGSAGAALVPLALAALGAPRLLAWMAAGLVAGSFALLAFAPGPLAAELERAGGRTGSGIESLTLGWIGPVLAVAALALAWRAVRGAASAPTSAPQKALVVWALAEGALSPFISSSASVRRVIGMLVALSLVAAAQLAERAVRDPGRRAMAWMVTVLGMALGLAFWAVDLDSAHTERRALRLALALTGPPGANNAVACVADHWGAFQQAAHEARLARITAEGPPLAAGSWLLVPFGVEMRGVELDVSRLALVDSVPLPHRLPLTTRRAFYDGRYALRRVDPAWVGARIYRVTRGGAVVRGRENGAARRRN